MKHKKNIKKNKAHRGRPILMIITDIKTYIDRQKRQYKITNEDKLAWQKQGST